MAIEDQVRDFYDERGWQADSSGPTAVYGDAQLWEDLRPCAAEYVSACRRKVLEFLDRGGELILDAFRNPTGEVFVVLEGDVDLWNDADTRADGEAPVARHGDLAAEFMAGHVWELRRRKLAREYFRVGRADHRRPHAYQDLARSGTGRRYLAQRDLILRAEDHGQHRRGYVRRPG